MENKEVEKTYISNCCSAEVKGGISWNDGVGSARCPECFEGCMVEILEEEVEEELN